MTRFDEFVKQAIYPQRPYKSTPESYAGIERSSYPHWLGWEVIDKAKKSATFPANIAGDDNLQRLVNAHFKRFFFDEMRLDEITDTEIAMELFEAGCAVGRSLAIRLMQQTINLLADNDRYFPVEENGMVSDHMIGRINTYEKPDSLLVAYMVVIGGRYANDPAFFRDWIGR